jgi:hypothetical protein
MVVFGKRGEEIVKRVVKALQKKAVCPMNWGFCPVSKKKCPVNFEKCPVSLKSV